MPDKNPSQRISLNRRFIISNKRLFINTFSLLPFSRNPENILLNELKKAEGKIQSEPFVY
jgi:hypothetical protein